jgi:hypothetical protein
VEFELGGVQLTSASLPKRITYENSKILRTFNTLHCQKYRNALQGRSLVSLSVNGRAGEKSKQ